MEIYNDKGEYDRALESYKKSLEIRIQSLPWNHPDIASSYTKIGHIWY